MPSLGERGRRADVAGTKNPSEAPEAREGRMRRVWWKEP
jgi:hypothetical protein